MRAAVLKLWAGDASNGPVVRVDQLMLQFLSGGSALMIRVEATLGN